MTDRDFSFASESIYFDVFSFLGFELSRDYRAPEVNAVVAGIPYDLATSGRPGARGGPEAIRRASANLRWESRRWPWDFALADRLRAIDYGDLHYRYGESEDMLAQVEALAANVSAAGKTLVSLGGDHFVTLPLLRGHARTYGTLALIHFDAHTDTYGDDEQYSHGTMFHHAPAEGLIDPAHSVQIGIRTDHDRQESPFQVIDAFRANEQPVEATVEAIRARVGDMPAYLSFDIDCLDPAYAPGTGTPVVGGLTTSRTLRILRGLAGLNIVGFDLMEVAPAYDHAQITALAGATLVLDFLYMSASRA